MILDSIIRFIGSIYPVIKPINIFIGNALSFLILYRYAYEFIGLFFTRKFKPAKKNHKYGIVIAARNEEKVIGNLLDSIKKQDYPQELLTVFVVADNCTDNTANIARSNGAIVYERFDDKRKTKGYALEFLFDNIERDYKTSSFEAFFVFDADNLLKNNYISKMNDAYDSGEKLVTSYRNIKNIDENWITMSFAVHWLRTIRKYHRPRSFLRLATNIQGTGYLFDSSVVKNGWHYTSLTEDRGLTADAVSQGYRISYQNDAIFYDEQTPKVMVAYNQKLRWSKGLLINFRESGFKLFRNIFCGKRFTKIKWYEEEEKYSKPKKFLIGIRDRYINFDTFMHLLPSSVIHIFRWIFVTLIIKSCYAYSHPYLNMNVFGGNFWLAKIINRYFNIRMNIPTGYQGILTILLLSIWLRLFYRIACYIKNIVIPWFYLFLERKRIKKIPIWKVILYSIPFPIFDIVGRWTTYIALFKKIEWKPVPHESKITIDDINKEVKN